MQDHAIVVEGSPNSALRAVDEAAEVWGAEWSRFGTGGRLDLPVRAGLRRGSLLGRISTEGHKGNATRVSFQPEEAHYALQPAQVVVLLLGGLGGLVTVLVPFYPTLMGLVPLSGLLLLLAWFLVASRFGSQGAEEFLSLVGDITVELEAEGDEARSASAGEE